MTISSTPRATSVFDHVESVMDDAASSCDPVAILRGWSEIEVAGTEVERAQGELVAFMALAYYLEALSERDVTPDELADFKERAEALRLRVQDETLICAIDDLVSAAGRGLTIIHPKTLGGEHHALTAAYQIYGDISRAHDLLDWSGGVSGALIADPQYR